MKKIFSSILAVALLISCFATISFADEVPPQLTGEVTDLGESEGVYSYSLKIYLENPPVVTATKPAMGSTYKYTGDVINGYGIPFTITATKADGSPAISSAENSEEFDYMYEKVEGGDYAVTPKTGGFALSKSGSDPIAAVNKLSIASTDRILLGEVTFYTFEGVNIKINWDTANAISLSTITCNNTAISSGKVSDARTYDNGKLQLKEATKDGFKIGGSTDPEPPATETKTFAATITSSAKPLAADTLRFLFDVTEDGVVKVKGYDLVLGVDFDTNATINAALQVKDIDTSKVTSFAFKSVAWAE